MHVDPTIIAALEKIRDWALDQEVAARDGSGGEHEAPPEHDEPPMDESPGEEIADEHEADEPGDKPGFTSLGSYRFGGKPKVQAVEVDVRNTKHHKKRY